MKAKHYHSNSWRGILKERDWMQRQISYTIADGNNTNLWYDPWVNGRSIYQLYGDRVRLNLGAAKNMNVSAFIDNGAWNLPPATSPDMISLWPVINAISIQPQQVDKVIWKHEHGVFSTTSAWNALRERQQLLPLHSWIWNRPVPPKFALCMWQAFLSKLPTLDHVQRRGVHLANRCSLCWRHEETNAHIFWRCSYAKWIWKEILTRFDFTRPPEQTIQLELEALSINFSQKKGTTLVAQLALRTATWWIWRERCLRIFEEKQKSKVQLLLCILDDMRTCMESHPLKALSARERNIFKRFNICPLLKD